MFNRRIKELEKEVNSFRKLIVEELAELNDSISKLEEKERENFSLVKTNIENFEFKIQDKLDDFHKEISDKYIKAIENIIQVTKETMLIDTLIKQVSEKDLANLKRTLMQPILEERIKVADKVKADSAEETIKTKGEKIMAIKKDLEERFLKLDRKEKDTTIIKAQLDLINSLLEVTGEETSRI